MVRQPAAEPMPNGFAISDLSSLRFSSCELKRVHAQKEQIGQGHPTPHRGEFFNNTMSTL